ncbi:MAG: TRAP transporter small permease [Oscillospiraceae bacterium]|jgi:TRAP-type C4-dicarboxylate transport system permease small subunit|nr:TRAP transporter small permease [Oscillospiraceae bacterium]
MKAFRKFNEAVGKAEFVIALVMTAAIIVLVFLSAVLRTVRLPIVWSVDVAQLLFVWICSLGADVALKHKAHIGVDLLVRKFPTKLQNAVTLGSYFLIIAFLMFIMYYGVGLCFENYLRKYQTLKVSYSLGTAAVPVGCFFMLLTTAEQIVDLRKNWGKPNVV